MFYLQYRAFMSIFLKYSCTFTRRNWNNKQYKYRKHLLFYRNTVAKVTLYFAVKYCVLRVSERDVYTCDSPQPLPTLPPLQLLPPSAHPPRPQDVRLMTNKWLLFHKTYKPVQQVSSTSIFCFKLRNVPFYFYNTMN